MIKKPILRHRVRLRLGCNRPLHFILLILEEPLSYDTYFYNTALHFLLIPLVYPYSKICNYKKGTM